MKPKVLIIVGPTASGKSDLAVRLAKKLRGEVISADSRQVYKGLDAGTGKITKKEMLGVPHHLLGVAEPKKVFSVSDYKKLADKKLEEIIKRGKLPIIVGGTGFYIDALMGRASLPEVPPNPKLRKGFGTKSAEILFKLLQKKDPARAKTIDKQNKVRLVRALEIVEALGKVPKLKSKEMPFDIVWIGLNPDREELDEKILTRIKARMAKMIKEAKSLHKKGMSWKRMEELGLEYRYLARLLQKKLTKREFVEELYTETKKYSKRQMTWFKTNKDITWYPTSESAFEAIR